MQILLLSEPNSLGEILIDYTTKLSAVMEAEVHVLNIVRVEGEIPLKRNGEVLDDCTEFDLSPYLNESSNKKIKLLSMVKGSNFKLHTKVGNPEKIVLDFIENQNIDLIVSGAKLSEGSEDLFKTTFAGRVLAESKVPFLTLKCERDFDKTHKIALVGDFTGVEKRKNLNGLKKIQKALGVGLKLVRINTPADFVSSSELKVKMKEFADLNELENVEFEIYSAESKEKGVEELVTNEDIDFLAVGHMVRKNAPIFLNSDLKTDIVNHVLAPIYIY